MSVMAADVLGQSTQAAPLRVVAAGMMGSAGADRFEDVAIAKDGEIYVAGNFAGAVELKTTVLGEEGGGYGVGAVLKFDKDGQQVVAGVTFAKGLAKVTSLAVNERGVYVAGYATGGAEKLFGPLGGLHAKVVTPPPTGKLFVAKEHSDEPKFKLEHDVRGAPFVARLSHDLGRLEAATFLEGYQSIWYVPENIREDVYQPTGLALLSNGDVIVTHDGGYNRAFKAGTQPTIEDYYFVPDHISRLSADLKRRAWREELYTPKVNKEHAGRGIKGEWKHDTMGNPRIFRVRVDARDHVLVSGWSASRTVAEPWWSPFLRKYDSDGKLVWTAYEHEPTSGRDQRMNGQVSDAYVRSVAVDEKNRLLVSLTGDGGNNVLRQDPRDYTREAENLRGSVAGFKGRILFWGAVARLDSESRELLGGNHFNASGLITWGYGKGRTGTMPIWAEDLCDAGEGRVVAVGRQYGGFELPENTLWKGPGAFVRVFDERFSAVYTTAVPDATLTTVARHGNRFVAVGETLGEKAVSERAPWAKRAGKQDGFLILFELSSSEKKN